MTPRGVILLLGSQLLTGTKDHASFGAFVGSELVSMSTAYCMGTEGKQLAWLSFVATRSDFRRKGLARQVTTACLKWMDEKHPGVPIGLYGEISKAAPLYRDLGFKDVGRTFHWTTKVSGGGAGGFAGCGVGGGMWKARCGACRGGGCLWMGGVLIAMLARYEV